MENEKHYLGKLCKNNHEYEDSGETLRFLSDRSCIECKRLKFKQKSEKRKSINKEKVYVWEYVNKRKNKFKTNRV